MVTTKSRFAAKANRKPKAIAKTITKATKTATATTKQLNFVVD